jgi:hypothetical protein
MDAGTICRTAVDLAVLARNRSNGMDEAEEVLAMAASIVRIEKSHFEVYLSHISARISPFDDAPFQGLLDKPVNLESGG